MTFNLDFLNLDLLKRYSRYTFLGVYLLLNLSLGIYLYQLYQTKIENRHLIIKKTTLLREKRRELKDSSNAIQGELEKDRITVVRYQTQETKWHDYPQLRVRTILQGDINGLVKILNALETCLLYTSPSPRDRTRSRMPSSA